MELIIASGHELVRAMHRTTFEITREEHLTESGDCVIAVKSDKSVADLSRDFRGAVKKQGSEVSITIEAGDEKETVRAEGDLRISLTHPTDIVVRKSCYVCNRTLAVKADKSAADLSRRLVKRLQDPEQIVRITLTVNVSNQRV